MKFRTTDLIARIDEQIARIEKKDEEDFVKALTAYQKARDTWLADAEHWNTFANKIKARLRKNEPVTLADAPQKIRSRYSGLTFFDEEAPRKMKTHTTRLTTLRAALSAIEDEYVTTTSLKEIGFKDVARLFQGG